MDSIGLKRAMAHDYSLKLSQVVTRGLRAHAERGQWVGGRPPYGLRRALRQPDGALIVLDRWRAKGETVVLVADQIEAAVVVEIYECYVERGMGLAAIAEMLNARGVPAPTSDRRQGVRAWTKGTLWALATRILHRASACRSSSSRMLGMPVLGP